MPANLEETIRTSATENRLPCPKAFEIARELKVSRREVGDAVNRLEIRLIDCQLGCFGLDKSRHTDLAAMEIDPALVAEVVKSSVMGQIPCPVAFQVAAKCKVTTKDVGDAATRQKIRITNCQLGCF